MRHDCPDDEVEHLARAISETKRLIEQTERLLDTADAVVQPRLIEHCQAQPLSAESEWTPRDTL